MPKEKTLEEYREELKKYSSNHEIIGIQRSLKRKRNEVIVKH